MSMKQTIILSVFPYTLNIHDLENEESLDDTKPIYDILYIDKLSSFRWYQRPYTEEELQSKAKLWDSQPHLLSSEGYLSQLRTITTNKLNPDYPKNLINYLSENMGKVDFIILPADVANQSYLTEADIDFVTVLPDVHSQPEYVGKAYLANDKATLHQFSYGWDNLIQSLSKVPGTKLYQLEAGESIRLKHLDNLYEEIQRLATLQNPPHM